MFPLINYIYLYISICVGSREEYSTLKRDVFAFFHFYNSVYILLSQRKSMCEFQAIFWISIEIGRTWRPFLEIYYSIFSSIHLFCCCGGLSGWITYTNRKLTTIKQCKQQANYI